MTSVLTLVQRGIFGSPIDEAADVSYLADTVVLLRYFEVSGSVPVTFADWNIPNPSFGGVVTTEDHGVMEFLLNLSHA